MASFFTKDINVDFLFQIADYDKDGVININDATRFFSGANLTAQEMGTIWSITVTNIGQGVLTRENFGKALTLISLTQQRLPLTAASLSAGGLEPPVFMDLDPATDRAAYEAIFAKSMDPGARKVSGQTAFTLFTNYGIDRQVLFKVWQLADMDVDGALSEKEFLVAMALIKHAHSGRVVPDMVPSTLIFSVNNAVSVNTTEVNPNPKPKPKQPVAVAPSKSAFVMGSSSSNSNASPAQQRRSQQFKSVDLFGGDNNNSFFSASSSEITAESKSTQNVTIFDDKDNLFLSSSSSSSMSPGQKRRSQQITSTDLFNNNNNNNNNDLFPPTTITVSKPSDSKPSSSSTSNTNLFADDNNSFFPSSSSSSSTTTTTSTVQAQTSLFDSNNNNKNNNTNNNKFNEKSDNYNDGKVEEEEEAEGEDEEEVKRLTEQIVFIQKELKDIREVVETKKVQAQTIKDRNASLASQEDALQRRCKAVHDEAALRETDLVRMEEEAEQSRRSIKAAEDSIEASARAAEEARARSEQLGTELGAALTKYSNALTANSAQREMLTKEKEKLRAAETAELPSNPLDALPRSRIFGPGYAPAAAAAHEDSRKDPFDTSDMVMQAPNLWCYEPFKLD